MLTVVLLTATAGVTVDLARYASASDGRLLPGTVIGGVAVGGLLPEVAHERVSAQVTATLERTVAVTYGGQRWTRTAAQLGVTVDLERQLAAAVDAAQVDWLAHARHRYLGHRRGPVLDLTLSDPGPGVERWLDGVADGIDRPTVDAALSYDDTRVRVTPHQVGLTVDRGAATRAVTRAVTRALASPDASASSVPLQARRSVPDVTTDDLGQVLFLDQSEHRLDLYLDGRLAHSYTVTVGTGRYPTPRGEFTVTLKRPNPTWVNPAPNGWGRGMPGSIGPGPTNPLGLRALNWSIGAIRFHGTADVDNLGRDASHGCVRLANADIVHLYDLVDVGARIISVD